MPARAIMLQGTASNVGKSLLAAGYARAFTNRGLKVKPFKPQNMSNNAAVTADGGEIGRAQALQALAARTEPVSDMNPILLKPETNTGAQIIVQGKRSQTLSAREYFKQRAKLLPKVLDSFQRLTRNTDLVIVEGAGSPAEINLSAGDIANMGFATAADVPVVLIGDVHRGGVIAAIAGTLQVIKPKEHNMIKGFLINNFHGDITLFSDAVTMIEDLCAKPCLGVVPHFADAGKLPAEDAVALEDSISSGKGTCRIAVLRLSRICNFDDLDPLRLEPDVEVNMIQPGQAVPAGVDLLIIPGTKSTIADLRYLRAQGWDIDIAAHVRRGGRVLGICGGYQMLGRAVHDPLGLEGPPASEPGLALLNVETRLEAEKQLTRVEAVHEQTGQAMTGYEIHLGRTTGPDCTRPFSRIAGKPDGACSASGAIAGTYLHGAMASDRFRAAFITGLGAQSGGLLFDSDIDKTLDDLAMHLATNTDIDRLLALARPL